MSTNAIEHVRNESVVFLTQILNQSTDLIPSTEFAFNRNRRSKKLKLAKPDIHDSGVFAMESITLGSILIEYVGDKVRKCVGEVRGMIKDSYYLGPHDDMIIDTKTAVE